MPTITVDLTDARAEALAQMCKRFGLHHATSLANASDGGRERDHMLGAVAALRRALSEVGFDPR